MKNEKGITLVEVLSTLALVSVITVLLVSIVVDASSRADRQQDESLSTRQMTFVLNSITTDVRRSPEEIAVQPAELTIPSDDQTIVYSFDANKKELFKNGTSIAKGLADFTVSLNGDTLDIVMKNTASKQWHTQIVLRKGTDL